MDNFPFDLEKEIISIENEVISIREYLHSEPELSKNERNTSKYIKNKLIEYGIKNITEYKNYGLCALIEGENKNIVIGIRAEMDALPINEANDVPYRSRNEGVMHACGHDVHTSILLGVARIAQKHKNHLPFSLKLIFQPSEEVLPGGAYELIKERVLENPEANVMLALHVLPELEVGKFGFGKGEYMASSDEIHIKITGKGGHAAFPEQIINPIDCTAEFVLTSKKVANDNIKNEKFVLNYGLFEARGATNVIPNEAYLKGTLRTFSGKTRNLLHNLINQTLTEVCTKYKTEKEIEIIKGYPVLTNNVELTETIKKYFSKYFEPEKIVELPQRMTADDFAFFSEKLPSCYFRLGVGTPGVETRKLHTPYFDVDKKSFYYGLKSMFVAIFGSYNFIVDKLKNF